MPRLLELLLLAITAPIWVPILVVVGLCVRARIGSPVLFRQVRPGFHGEEFELLKFRSMTDARDESGAPLPDDQRLTPFGRRLRATSLDELPELLNVVKGEMSLVGPRPLLMQYLPLYSSRHRKRHDVRPGLTGWAQISGRNALSWKERLDLDVWYVEHRSLLLDVRILIRTLRTVLSREGIHAEGHATMRPFTGYGE
jgi:lipopolysaccharide/colanic/teichoic acid biosynthesis glycosyltransferase